MYIYFPISKNANDSLARSGRYLVSFRLKPESGNRGRNRIAGDAHVHDAGPSARQRKTHGFGDLAVAVDRHPLGIQRPGQSRIVGMLSELGADDAPPVAGLLPSAGWLPASGC